MEDKKAVGTATGKIILMGEHAVVYGEPALAIPFSTTKVVATITKKEGPISLDCVFYKGPLAHAPERLLGLKTIIEKIMENFDRPLKDINIKIESSIPPERGMGSSAAVAIATIRALYDYFNWSLSNDDLVRWSDISEKIIHGNPSGLDAAVIIGEESLYYIKGKPFIPFHCQLDAYLIVADTGEKGHTREAVEGVRELIQSNPDQGQAWIKELGDLANSAKTSIEENNPSLLGKLMTGAHVILDKLGVSNPTLNQLVNVALDNGALGAKLTGGGRGGCMIVLTSTKEKAKLIAGSLLDNGAKDIWIHNMGVSTNGK